MLWFNTQTPVDHQISELTEEIKKLSKHVAALEGEKEYLDERRKLEDSVSDLKQKIETLKIEKERIEEGHEREKREVKHMVGLERKRQEWEHEKAMENVDAERRQAVLEVREENLAQEREAFEKQMKFITERFTSEVSSLQKMLEKAIPNIDIALNNDRAVNDG